MTADRPATEPRPFYDGPVCSRCGHEPHDDRPDPRCGEIVGGWDQPMPTPDYCGCADVDALYGRLIRAEAAQGAAPRQQVVAEIRERLSRTRWMPGDVEEALATVSEGAAPRAEGLRMALQEVVDQLDDYGPNGPGFARAIEHARSVLARAEGQDVPAIRGESDHALEALRHLFWIMERLDKQAGPPFSHDHNVKITSETWLDLVRPAIRTVQSRLSRPSDERIPAVLRTSSGVHFGKREIYPPGSRSRRVPESEESDDR